MIMVKTKKICPECLEITTKTKGMFGQFIEKFFVKSIKLRRSYIKINIKIGKNKYKSKLFAIGWYCPSCGYFEKDSEEGCEAKSYIETLNRGKMEQMLWRFPKKARDLYKELLEKEQLGKEKSQEYWRKQRES